MQLAASEPVEIFDRFAHTELSVKRICGDLQIFSNLVAMKFINDNLSYIFWGWIVALFAGALIPGLGFTHARVDGYSFRADYVAHALVFFVITAIFAHGRSRQIHLLNRYGWMKLAAICVVLTISIETFQGLTGRTFSYHDMVANGIGFAFGLFFFLTIEWVKA